MLYLFNIALAFFALTRAASAAKSKAQARAALAQAKRLAELLEHAIGERDAARATVLRIHNALAKGDTAGAYLAIGEALTGTSVPPSSRRPSSIADRLRKLRSDCDELSPHHAGRAHA